MVPSSGEHHSPLAEYSQAVAPALEVTVADRELGPCPAYAPATLPSARDWGRSARALELY
jgi:hypothetical protein